MISKEDVINAVKLYMKNKGRNITLEGDPTSAPILYQGRESFVFSYLLHLLTDRRVFCDRALKGSNFIAVKISPFASGVLVVSTDLRLEILYNQFLQNNGIYLEHRPITPPHKGNSIYIIIGQMYVQNFHNVLKLSKLLGEILKYKIVGLTRTKCKYCGAEGITYPEICIHHLTRLSRHDLKYFRDHFELRDDPTFLYVSKDWHTVHRQLLNLKRFQTYSKKYMYCVECGKKINGHYTYVTTSVCSKCGELFDWDKFKLEYINRKVTWKSFNSSSKVRERYKLKKKIIKENTSEEVSRISSIDTIIYRYVVNSSYTSSYCCNYIDGGSTCVE